LEFGPVYLRTVVDVVVLLDPPKQAMAQTITAVATTPPTISASVDRNIAWCSPAGGLGGNSGAAAGGGGGAEVSLGALPEVTPPDAVAPPLSPWANRVSRTTPPEAVWAHDDVTFALSIVAASANANQFLCIGTSNIQTVGLASQRLKRPKRRKAASRSQTMLRVGA
jgi:hypothetical protein